MPGINSRSKGARNERQIAKLFADWSKKEFSKTPASGGLQWKSANAKGDIVCTTEGHFFPFCIEAKSHKEINFSHLLIPMRVTKKNPKPICKIMEFWKQCNRDAKKCSKIPMLLMRYNGMPEDFHFLVTTQTFAKIMHEELALSNDGLFSLRYSDYKTGTHLMIMRSTQVFNTEYKVIKLLAKQHIKEIYGKRKS